MKNLIDKILGEKQSFKRNALIMSSGAALNVLISVGLYPIITRIFSKEQFGGLGLYMAVVSLIALAGTSLYPSGLVIPKFRRDFYRLVKLSLSLAILAVAITLVFLIFFKSAFVYAFKLNTLGNYIYLIPVGVALACLRDISINWNVRNKDFDKNAFSSVASSGGLKAINILHGLILNPSLIGLIIADWISLIIAITTLGLRKMITGLGVLKRITFQETIGIAKKYKKYPLNLLPGNLLNKYTADLPIYMLTAYFSPAITGAFVLANNILNIPMGVIGNSIASVFLQKANELYLSDPEEMSRFAYETNRKMLLIGVAAFGVLFGFGDIIFAIAFGKKWTIAGVFAGILSVYFVFKLIAGPMAKVFRVVGKEQYSLYVSTILAIARAISIYLGVVSGDAILAIIYFAIANGLGYFITYLFVFKACRIPIIKPMIETLMIVLVGFSAFYTLRYGLEKVIDFSPWLEKFG